MNALSQKLLCGGSTVALLLGIANEAMAQATIATAPATEEVTVTGTSLRNVAPIGSSVISVDQEAIKAASPVSMQELLNQVPGMSTTGAPPQGTSINSFFTPQIHQLAGSISNSTLTVVNGLRLVGVGGDTLPDPNIIPTAAIERVEVLAGGASSIYGSDAVSGVVNFILRKKYDGVEINLQAGAGDQYNNTQGSLLWGTSWDTGSVMFAAGYVFQSRLQANSRDFLIAGDYTPYGGTNYPMLFGCPTASIQVPGNSGVYLSPSATTTVPNTQAAHNCNPTVYGDSLPESTRRNALLSVTQDFGPRLTTSVMMNYNTLNTNARLMPGSVTGITVFGPGSAATKPTQVNPFYTAPAGSPGSTVSQTINWVDLLGNGNGVDRFGTRYLQEQTFYGTFTATYKITDKWQATFSDSTGQGTFDTSVIGGFNQSLAILALNGTGQRNGSTTTTDIAGQNVIALQTLNASNALDVWTPAGSGNRTNPLVAQNIYKGTTWGRSNNTFNQARLQADGPLFDLPAGTVNLALGGEYQIYHLITDATTSNGTGDLTNGVQERLFRSKRNVFSAFLEANFPIISAEMNVPMIQSLDVDISGRYDAYSDVGNTGNPRYALDWGITDGIKIKANYSTSFVAPPVGVLGDPAQGGEFSGGATIPAPFNVPIKAFPDVVNLPGCNTPAVAAAGFCSIGSGTLAPGIDRQYGGALNGVKPQTGNSYSIGLDFVPTFLPGLSTNITYFNQIYKGGVTAPNQNQITTYAPLFHLLQLYPNGATQAQIDAFTRVPQGGTVSGALPPTVYFTLNRDENNVLNLNIEGFDVVANYDFDTEFGHFRIGEAFTQFINFDQNFAGSAGFSILNTSGLNSTFPSIALQSRTTFAWSNDALELTAFVNFTGSYWNAGNFTVHPLLSDANGNFAGGGDKVSSNTTLDLHAAYNFEGGMFGGDQIYIDIKNAFDTDPPFYNYANRGDTLSNNGYNPFVSNPIGRIISAGVRAKL